MRFRKLRVAWSVVWGVVAALLCVLWVRSYWHMDIVAIPSPPKRLMAASYYGRIYWSKVALDRAVSKPSAVDSFSIHDDWTLLQQVIDDLFADGTFHNVRHVFWVLAAGTLAAVPWAESKWRFCYVGACQEGAFTCLASAS
jgi:hypothetical protein